VIFVTTLGVSVPIIGRESAPSVTSSKIEKSLDSYVKFVTLLFLNVRTTTIYAKIAIMVISDVYESELCPRPFVLEQLFRYSNDENNCDFCFRIFTKNNDDLDWYHLAGIECFQCHKETEICGFTCQDCRSKVKGSSILPDPQFLCLVCKNGRL